MSKCSNILKTATLCSLLVGSSLSVSNSDLDDQIRNKHQSDFMAALNKMNSVDPNEKLDLNSASHFSMNAYGDKTTLDGIENGLKKTLNYERFSDNFVDAYKNSTSQLLVLSGHHFTGTISFMDNKRNIFPLNKLEPNPNYQVLLMRGCHTVMNPVFLNEYSDSLHHMTFNAEEIIYHFTRIAPNLRLMVGYETKSPNRNDVALIRLAENISKVETQGLKSYGDYAIKLTNKLFADPRHEKDKEGNWTYNVNFQTYDWEGIRLAYYIKETSGWKYYSLDHPEGLDVSITK